MVSKPALSLQVADLLGVKACPAPLADSVRDALQGAKGGNVEREIWWASAFDATKCPTAALPSPVVDKKQKGKK